LYNEDFTNRSFPEQFKNNAGEYIGLNLNVPLFNRFSVRNQVRNARFNMEDQQLTMENIKKDLYKEIQTACLNAIASQEKYKASQEAVKSASESFKYTQERYEAGKSTVFEFNEAKTKLIKSRSEAAQAKYDYMFRTKILDFYNGMPIKL
jgi:outer membrane protein